VPRAQMTWWDDVVGREFLAPFGLNNATSFFTWQGTRGRVDARVKERLGGAVPVYVGGREGRCARVCVLDGILPNTPTTTKNTRHTH
jgi:hypothetical protein